MNSDGFEGRVRSLRTGWDDRRELQELGSEHDFDSRFRLLLSIHAWVRSAAAAIETVYGPEATVALSAPPGPTEATPAISLTLFGIYGLRFFLAERMRNGASTWSVVGSMRVPNGRSESSTSVGPDRRGGAWTRGRIEEILLTMVSAYERDRLAETSAEHRGPMRLRYVGVLD